MPARGTGKEGCRPGDGACHQHDLREEETFSGTKAHREEVYVRTSMSRRQQGAREQAQLQGSHRRTGEREGISTRGTLAVKSVCALAGRTCACGSTMSRSPMRICGTRQFKCNSSSDLIVTSFP